MARYSSYRCWFLLFAFTRSTAFRPPPLSEELGKSPTLSILLNRDSFYFDPLGIATDVNFSRLREAELKHGRIAMLAITETIAVPILKKVKFDWVPSDLPNGFIQSAKSLTTIDCLKVILTCGILETLVFTQKDLKDMPGDYQTGYFGVRDKGLHERELTAELENGRLAMLAILVQFVAEIITGETFQQQWILLFKRWAQAL